MVKLIEKHEKATKSIGCRVTPSAYDEIQRVCSERGVKIVEFVRTAVEKEIAGTR